MSPRGKLRFALRSNEVSLFQVQPTLETTEKVKIEEEKLKLYITVKLITIILNN